MESSTITSTGAKVVFLNSRSSLVKWHVHCPVAYPIGRPTLAAVLEPPSAWSHRSLLRLDASRSGLVVERQRAALGEFVEAGSAFDLGTIDECCAFESAGLHADGAGKEPSPAFYVLSM